MEKAHNFTTTDIFAEHLTLTFSLDNDRNPVGRNKVRRLMRFMGLEAIYRRPNTSKPAPEHRVYPSLLRGVEINRVNQVWAADITYIPMAKGLVAIMDPDIIGTGTCCPGGYPIPWTWISASKLWKKP